MPVIIGGEGKWIQELPDSALSIADRAGESLVWNGRPHWFESLKGGRARVLSAHWPDSAINSAS
jgi:hypothetical protein